MKNQSTLSPLPSRLTTVSFQQQQQQQAKQHTQINDDMKRANAIAIEWIVYDVAQRVRLLANQTRRFFLINTLAHSNTVYSENDGNVGSVPAAKHVYNSLSLFLRMIVVIYTRDVLNKQRN